MSPTDPNTGNNTAAQSVQVAQATADVTVQMTDSPDPVRVGSTLTYTITVRNNGPDMAAGVTLTDTLPAA